MSNKNQLPGTNELIWKAVKNPDKAAQFAIDKLSPYAQIPEAVLTLPIKTKPDFFVIGAAKSGTTSLREYIRLHESILYKKDVKIDRPNEYWITGHWRDRACRHSKLDEVVRSGDFKTFEKNVGFLCDFRIPKRMHRHNPEAKFIIILRDPVDRLISQYYGNSQTGSRELLSFREALQKEESRIKSERKRMQEDESYPMKYYGHYAYKQRSKYINQIDNWLDYFPRNQFLFLEFEEFFSQPEKGIQEVFEFVGVAKQPVEINRKFNTGDYQRDIDDSIIKDLREEFRPFNQKLYNLIGRDLNWGY